MSILIDGDPRVIVQGVTRKMARLHIREMVDYGTNFVVGVPPGRGRDTVEGKPVFDAVQIDSVVGLLP